MKRVAPISHYLACLWRWSHKWLVHIWLGIPLGAAFMGWLGGGLDQYQDFGEYALKAPRIERKGLIKSIDLRRRHQVLVTDKERLSVKCGLPYNNGCIKYLTPIKVSVKLFRYRNYYVIIDMVDENKNHILIEKQRINSILKSVHSYKDNTTYASIIQMIVMSFVIVIPLMIGIPILRIMGRRNAMKMGAGYGKQ